MPYTIGAFCILIFCLSSGGSVLGDLAKSMKPGTWAELSTNGIDAALEQPGSGWSNIVPSSNSGAWDNNRRIFHFVGKTAGTAPLRHVAYREATNTWTTENNFLGGSTRGHGYDHNVGVDSETGTFFFRHGGNTIYAHPPNGSWGAESSWPKNGYVTVAIGTTLWDGVLSGVTKKALIIYNSGRPEIQIYDISRKTWLPRLHGFGGQSTYHSGAEYSRVHNVAIVGGGNDNIRKVWRLNSDKTISPMPDTPLNWGGYLFSNCVADPVTGHFLFVGNGQIWEFDPRGTGQYTRLTGSRVPPSNVGNPFDDGLISAPVNNYGVVMYVSVNSRTNSVFLYKHSEPNNVRVKMKAASELAVSVYPNPFRSGLNLSFGNSKFKGSAIEAKIFTAGGKLISLLTPNAHNPNSFMWKAPAHPNGVYLVRVSGNGQTVSKKVYLRK